MDVLPEVVLRKSEVMINSYDLVPYKNHSFRQTRPYQLAVISRIMRAKTHFIRSDQGREFEFVSGRNLLLLGRGRVFGSDFLGIDDSEEQTSEREKLLKGGAH